VSEPGSTPAGGYKDKNRKTVRAAERSQNYFLRTPPVHLLSVFLSAPEAIDD